MPQGMTAGTKADALFVAAAGAGDLVRAAARRALHVSDRDEIGSCRSTIGIVTVLLRHRGGKPERGTGGDAGLGARQLSGTGRDHHRGSPEIGILRVAELDVSAARRAEYKAWFETKTLEFDALAPVIGGGRRGCNYCEAGGKQESQHAGSPVNAKSMAQFQIVRRLLK
jgi:hypothetical protein